ncbi:MAG: hypothetical protein JXB04_08960, partial [Kiritimatiellae bacterium]|nr:hypothetical protein [Kiritimatiellia bacterium]
MKVISATFFQSLEKTNEKLPRFGNFEDGISKPWRTSYFLVPVQERTWSAIPDATGLPRGASRRPPAALMPEGHPPS